MNRASNLHILKSFSKQQLNLLFNFLYDKGLKNEMKIALDCAEHCNLNIDTVEYRQKLSELIVVAIHQPGFLPWPGYFHKIYYADHFVWLDHVNISSQNYIARVPIDSFSSGKYLRLPLKKHSHKASINSVEIAHDNWKDSHLGQLSFYRKTPFFDTIISLIKQWYEAINSTYINQINKQLFLELIKLLKIEKTINSSSSMQLNSNKQSLVVDITKQLNGNVYLSGTQAAVYQSESYFKENEVKLIYQKFFNYQESLPYQQSNEVFNNGLSILDLLFYHGPEKAIEHIKNYDIYSLSHCMQNLSLSKSPE